MIDMHVEKHGYTEVYLPYMVNRETALASGHLPGFQEEMYHDEEDDLWMLAHGRGGDNRPAQERDTGGGRPAPVLRGAHPPCWRREKASAGRDTRGIMRVHQFDKVEMYTSSSNPPAPTRSWRR